MVQNTDIKFSFKQKRMLKGDVKLSVKHRKSNKSEQVTCNCIYWLFTSHHIKLTAKKISCRSKCAERIFKEKIQFMV